MGNGTSISRQVLKLVETLSVFGTADLALLGEKTSHLSIILSRYTKQGKLLHLRKNLYAARSCLDSAERTGIVSAYIESAANRLYSPSYLHKRLYRPLSGPLSVSICKKKMFCLVADTE